MCPRQGDPAPEGGVPSCRNGALGAEPALDGGDQAGAGPEGDGVGQERQPGGKGEGGAAGRRADQLLADGEGGDQLAVGPGQAPRLAAGHGHHHGLGGVLEQGLAGPDQEPGHGQQRDAGPAGEHGHGQGPDDQRPGGVDGPHDPAPVQAVDQRPCGQGEQQPGQPAGEGDHRHGQRVAGQGGGQQRQGGQVHAVAEVGDGRGRPQPAVRPAEPAQWRRRNSARTCSISAWNSATMVAVPSG